MGCERGASNSVTRGNALLGLPLRFGPRHTGRVVPACGVAALGREGGGEVAEEDETGAPRRAFGRKRRANVPAGKPGRARRYEVSVTPDEDVQLQARAALRDVTVPRLLFESAMAAGLEIPAERKQAIVMLFKLQRQMATVANNVNQLARYANTEGRFPDTAVEVVAEYRRLARQVEASMGVVNGR